MTMIFWVDVAVWICPSISHRVCPSVIAIIASALWTMCPVRVCCPVPCALSAEAQSLTIFNLLPSECTIDILSASSTRSPARRELEALGSTSSVSMQMTSSRSMPSLSLPLCVCRIRVLNVFTINFHHFVCCAEWTYTCSPSLGLCCSVRNCALST